MFSNTFMDNMLKRKYKWNNEMNNGKIRDNEM